MGNSFFIRATVGAFQLIDVDTGKTFRVYPITFLRIDSLSFTPNGHTLIVGSRDKVQAWDAKTGAPQTVFGRGFAGTPQLAAVDNSSVLITGYIRGGLFLQNIDTGAVEREIMKERHLVDFQLGLNRKTCTGIVHDLKGRVIKRWDVESSKTIAEWLMPQGRQGFEPYDHCPFGCLALGGSRLFRLDEVRRGSKLSDESIDWGRTDLILEDWTTQQVTNRLELLTHYQLCVADASSKSFLAAVVSENFHTRVSLGLDSGSTYLLIWDLSSDKERVRVKRKRFDYFAAFSNVALSQYGRLAATVRHKTQIELWNGFTGELMQRFAANNEVVKLRFSEDGTVLASGHRDGGVFLWDTRTARDLSLP